MDRYTKFVLSIIAVGIIGINIHLFSNKIITNANASVAGMNASQLANDSDFWKAVVKVIQNRCSVSFGSSITCRGW